MCDVTKFIIRPPRQTMSHFVDPLAPVKVRRNLWMAPKACNKVWHS